MNREERISMIHQFLTGQLTPAQVDEFIHWRLEDPTNEALFIEVEKVWMSSSEYEMPMFNTKEALGSMPFATAIADPAESANEAKKASMSRFWMPRAAAVALIAVMAWLSYDMLGTEMLTASGNDASFVILSDGTEVFLTKGATLEYPKSFSGSTRAVILDGEAFFEVNPGSERFIVETDYASITVLGTKFGIDEDDATGIVDIDVTEGKVRVQPNGSEAFVDLQAGEEATFDSGTMELRPNRYANLNDVAWHTKRLVFRDTPFAQVIKDLEKAFDVSIEISSERLLGCGFTSSYSDTTIDTIFEDMTTLWGVSVMSVEEGSYSIKGGFCKQ